MIVTLGLSSVSCSFPSNENPSTGSLPPQQSSPVAQNRLADGQYPVQQVTYDDATGEYTVFLLNTAPGAAPLYRTTNLQMARLTPEEIEGGQQSYLAVAQGQPALHLTEDFRIEYVHNVTENVTNPQTGQPETVVVRRETGFWAPFAGALAGQALGSLLFTPHYYIPPVYQPGGRLVGYGGYGRSYGQAVQRYQTRYQTPPAEVRNRQTLRTAGRLRRSPGLTQPTNQPNIRRTSPQRDRAPGSGYGADNLRRSNPSRTNRSRPGSGFGTSRPSRSRSFRRR